METDDDIPYRAPYGLDLPGEAKDSIEDEAQFNTLKTIQKYLNQQVQALQKDFNAFDVLTHVNPKEAAEALLVEIMAKQAAYKILFPILEMLNGPISAVEAKTK